jgi:pimeloyl-ACP methyl ester carboxylesterase
MKQSIPAAAMVIMPNCGHTIHVENQDGFNAIFSDFLAREEQHQSPAYDKGRATL